MLELQRIADRDNRLNLVVSDVPDQRGGRLAVHVAHEAGLSVDLGQPRDETRASGSALDRRQIQPTEPVGIRQNVHLDNLAARDREADDRKQAPVRKTRHDADVAIHQDHLIGQRDLRESRCLRHNCLSTAHEARHPLHGSSVSPQYDIRIEYGDQRFEIAVLDGREKRVDDAALGPQVRV